MRPMIRLSVLAAVAVLAAGCADPSLEREADDLRDAVSALRGVDSAALDYTEPITLDSGKVLLTVRMDETAGADELTAVAETAYDAFSTTHHDEEADLEIRAGRTTVALRSFEPQASVDAVGRAVRTGLDATPAGAAVAIDLTTQEVAQGDHVAGSYVVTLPRGSVAADVPAFLTEAGAAHAGNALIGWGATAADGASLTYDRGFPPAEVVARWERLQAGGVPVALRAFANGALLAEARLEGRYDVADPADRRALDRITHAHLRGLGEDDFSYELYGSDGAAVASIDRYVCAPTSEGAYDDELEDWVSDRIGPCSVS